MVTATFVRLPARTRSVHALASELGTLAFLHASLAQQQLLLQVSA
ncbi:MAG: hypothetical protein ACI91B_004851, partial [Planctomycetota bacterium]